MTEVSFWGSSLCLIQRATVLDDATGQSACSALGQAVFHYSHGSTEYIVCMAEAKTLVQVPSAELGNNISWILFLFFIVCIGP